MGQAVAGMLEGMPAPRDLRLHRVGGRCLITVGATVLFDYDAADTAMRNMAISALRRLGFAGRRVAAVLGLTESYVATLHNLALREGSAALIRHSRPGRPGKLAEADWERAAAWRAQGISDAGIGRRLGVANTTVGRRLGPRQAARAPGPDATLPQAQPLSPEAEAGPEADLVPVPDGGLARPAGPAEAAAPAGSPVVAGPRVIEGSLYSRYAGAMLLHAFTSRADATTVLSAAAGQARDGGRRFADVALLSATSISFALGAATIEQVKHVTAHDGRAVCFVTGEPSGLTVTLPLALAELKKAAGPGAAIMLGFDRGGAYPQVFRHCREQDVDWVTYRRAPLAVPSRLPVLTTITVNGTARQVAWAEETVTIK